MAAKYPPGLLRDTQLEFDWDSYVREHFTIKPTSRDDELRICCIHCGEEEFKLYVNPRKKQFHCFKCPFSSKNFDTFDFVAKTEGLSRWQATARLVREYSATTPLDSDLMTHIAGMEGAKAPVVVPPIKTLKSLPVGLVPLLDRTDESAPFWDYLIGRGLTSDEIRAIGVHYTPLDSFPVFDDQGKRRGDLAKRVVVPVYGGDHELVSWQGRHISPEHKKDKYMTAPQSELAKTLWPFVKPFGTHAVLVEGIYDCLSVRRCAEVSAYATFSKKISVDQMLLLKSWGVEEVTLFWDKRDAKREMLDAIPELQMQFRKVYVCRMTDWPKEQDPGNLLADSNGSAKLMLALNDKVDTYDALEFASWTLAF